MKLINLNKKIKIKLTPKGVDIFYHKDDELNKWLKSIKAIPYEPCMPEIDKDGYTEMPLLVFMNIFGEHLGTGAPAGINPVVIYINDEDIEDVE